MVDGKYFFECLPFYCTMHRLLVCSMWQFIEVGVSGKLLGESPFDHKGNIPGNPPFHDLFTLPVTVEHCSTTVTIMGQTLFAFNYRYNSLQTIGQTEDKLGTLRGTFNGNITKMRSKALYLKVTSFMWSHFTVWGNVILCAKGLQ